MRKLGKWSGRILSIAVAVVLLLELSYRLYFIDFYRPELEAHNTGLELEEGRPTILFLGDSFTGNAKSYASLLRDELGFSMNVVNGAVSGTGIIETSILAEERIQEIEPDVVVYQIYLGNDLLDINHRITGESGLLRRLYYAVSDRMRVIKFLNYRLGQWRGQVYLDLKPQDDLQGKAFSPEHYNERQKLIFREEPDILKSTLSLENGRGNEFKRLVSGVSEMSEGLDPGTNLILLVIPHCAQVSDVYSDRMTEIGMGEFDPNAMTFYNQLEAAFPEIAIINPLEEFRRLERSGVELYFQDDPHLSPTGQTELAKLVEPILLEALD